MEELSAEEAELLLAVPEDAERLRWSRDKDALRAALRLTKGTAVTVDEGGQKLRGIIRYIGKLTEPTISCPLTGTFFGIELQVGVGKRSSKHSEGDYTLVVYNPQGL